VRKTPKNGILLVLVVVRVLARAGRIEDDEEEGDESRPGGH
jgi:hypothetical protein